MYHQYTSDLLRKQTSAAHHSETSEFADKVVIVTGASAGIGRETAILFAERGAKVVLVGRNKERLSEARDACAKANEHGHFLEVIAEVTKDEDLKKIVHETIAKFGQIDILVNNAGVSSVAGLMLTTPAIFEEIMNVNARAPLFLTQYCAPHLEKTKGCLVNVSSMVGTRGMPYALVYGMAKAAMDQLTRSACAELGPKGVRVNCVNPGLIATDFGLHAGATKEAVEATRAMFTKRTPAGAVGEAKQIAEVILFLASSKTYVHGVTLEADGGMFRVMA